MVAGRCRSGLPPGSMSARKPRKPWSGPCDGPPTVLTFARSWPQGRSPSTGSKPCPGSPKDVGRLEQVDVARVHREAALRARISSETEHRTTTDRFLVLQPTLDQSWWKLWGGLDGHSGAVVDKVLTEMADQQPPLPDGTRGGSSWRRATALIELAITDDPPPAQVSVFVDAELAADSNGRAGVTLVAGPRVGRDALEAILCDAVTEVTAQDGDGTPMSYGRRTRTIPPPPSAGPSSTATAEAVPETAVPADIVSRSTTSCPGAKAAPPTPTISSPSAGSTIRSSSTNKDSRSSDIPKPDASDSADPTPEDHPSPDDDLGRLNRGRPPKEPHYLNRTTGRHT